MTTLKVVLTVLHLIITFGLMAVVLFQSSKSEGLSGSIAGGAETFFGKNKGKTMDGILAKFTVVLAILFVITSVSLSALSKKASESDAADDNQSQVQEDTTSGADESTDENTDEDTDTEADVNTDENTDENADTNADAE